MSLLKKFEALRRLFLVLITLLLTIPQFSAAQAMESNDNQNTMTENECQAFLVNKSIEDQYNKIRAGFEKDFKSGLPYQLKTKLVAMRSNIDLLSGKSFDLEFNNQQEVNSMVKETLDQLESFIQILPAVANNAPKMRDQYIVPFTNINSLRAEQQACLLNAEIDKIKEEVSNPTMKEETQITDANIYQTLTEELNKLNANLYQAETLDVQKYVALRANLLNDLAQYNKEQDPQIARQIVAKIPQSIHSIQSEIEKLLPSLQLSEKYVSILDR